ncbi:helix-turn-helix transcriptional regulator [Cellulomonas sp. NPDC058312]|uniref:helix-turn-helix transcriptional regulator n=1 Tax=Cellulomonas sp. NPDC058312 TaxID=3346441 RepID=UPI0036EEA00E
MPTTSSRLLSLLSLLQARRDWPASVLADRLDVTDRTVRRDVDRLRELGYPITSTRGREGGYRLDAGSTLPPLLFDDDQAVALAVALRGATASGAGIGEAAERALRTLRQVLPARLRHRVDALPVESTLPADPVDPAVIAAVGAAIHAREVLRLDYASPSQGSAEARAARRVEPHHLVTRGGRWYLVAWDLDRDDWRTLRVDRVRPRSPGGARFTPREVPGGDVTAYLDARFRGTDGPGSDWPCRGEVLLDAPAAAVAPFAHDGTVEAVGPQRCRLVLGAWSWAGLAATIARFDVEVEVVGPPALAEAFDRLAQRFARAAHRA